MFAFVPLPARAITQLPPVRSLLLAVLLGATASRSAIAQHDMARMSDGPTSPLALDIPLTRLGSGTSWLPDASPMRSIDWRAGRWMLMAHGSVFGQFDQQTGLRGDDQFGIADHEMLMALRRFAGGALRLSAMTSLESFVIGDRGYPELLQTGGVYRSARIVNRQHPNDPLMELTASYERSLIRGIAVQVYGGPIGEPALGPVTYMHRPSAAADPFAPLGHHWQDASHDAPGVATVGLFTRFAKLEASAFNGREAPDDSSFLSRFDRVRLDSYSARLSVAPNAHLIGSTWAGYVYGHDPLDPNIGMQRYGAAINAATGRLSTAVVWGLMIHHHGIREHVHPATDTSTPPPSYHIAGSELIETTFDVTPGTSLYARAEQVQKTADDLGFLGGDLMQLFTIRDVAIGATHDVMSLGPASASIGARLSVEVLPETLRLDYHTRTPLGFAVFLRLRPHLSS